MISKLLWLEPFWLLGLAPFVLLPHLWQLTYAHYLVIAGLFLFWLLRFAFEGRAMVKTPLNIAGIFLLLSLPMGMSIAIDGASAREIAGYIFFSIAVAVGAIQWPFFYHHPERLAYVLVVVGLGLSGISFALYGKNLGSSKILIDWAIPLIQRLDGSINPNVVAGTLAHIMPLSFSALIAGPPNDNSFSLWRARGWAGLVTIILGTALWLTESRGGYVAALIGLGVVSGLHWPKFGRLLLFALLSCFIYIIWSWPMEPDSIHLFLAYSQATLFEDWLDRRVIWTQAWLALQDFPLTGIGVGQFSRVIPEFYPHFPRFNPTIPHAHNLWLQVCMDLGMFGLISYLALQINICFMLRQVYAYFNIVPAQGDRRRPRHNIRSLAYNAKVYHKKQWILTIGLYGSLSTLIVHGMIDAVAWGTKLSFTVGFLVAAVVLLFEQTT